MTNSCYPLIANLEAIKDAGHQDPDFVHAEIMRVLREEAISRGQDPEATNTYLRFEFAHSVFRDTAIIKKMIITTEATKGIRLVERTLANPSNLDFHAADFKSSCGSVFLLIFQIHTNVQHIINDTEFLTLIESVFHERADEFVEACKYHLRERILELFSTYPRRYPNAEAYFDDMLSVYQERHQTPLFGDVVKEAFETIKNKGLSNIRRS